MSDPGKGIKTTRIVVVILGITLWSFLILVRLIQLQVFEHRSFIQIASQKQQVTRSILAPRGIIYDSHMDELATSVPVSMVVADPHAIKDIPGAAQSLAEILEMNPQDLLNRMTDPAHRYYMVVKHRIDPNAERLIKSLGIEGVYLAEESMRVFPNRELACHVLGFVNMNGDGTYGLEQQYNKELQGKEGQFSFDVDARRRSFRVKVDKPPVQGHSLVLSIDKSIQYIADRELAAGVEKAQARAGTAIVMESDTGRILALSNYPQFNCNTYSDYEPDLWRNRGISDVFEPGSTFKVVVATAALEAGLTRQDEMIDCQMGSITIGRHLFHDHKGYGLLSFSQILEYSSNVGAAKLGLRLGEQRLYEALRTFGFGSKTGIDLPGEIVGIVRDWHDWSGLSIGAISFGQEVGVTSIQILTAINAIANGGYRVRPSIVDRIIDEAGDLVSVNAPERVRLMSPRTAEAVSNAFEGVVLRGTGRRAALEGYRAAGKTGTAQKIVDGHYSPSKYVSSFIGFAPLPHPRFTILVQIDEPKGVHYGGDVSAPFFQKIAQEALLQLRVPPDPSLPLPQFKPLVADRSTEDYIPDAVQPLKSPRKASKEEPEQQEAIVIPVGAGNPVAIPDFRGLGKRTVLDLCLALGINLQASGAGIAVFQSPMPGTKVPSGTTCNVTFAKANLKEQLTAADQRYAAQRANPRPSSAIRQ
ncbi:MAG: penicillin-binding transpeptidase domain-containing protein [Acidobacteriota bacterium]